MEPFFSFSFLVFGCCRVPVAGFATVNGCFTNIIPRVVGFAAQCYSPLPVRAIVVRSLFGCPFTSRGLSKSFTAVATFPCRCLFFFLTVHSLVFLSISLAVFPLLSFIGYT